MTNATKIILDETFGASRSLTISCGKTTAEIFNGESLGLRIVCKNASNRAWRGMGRGFDNFTEALGAYKSKAMQAIIVRAASEMM